MDSWSTDISFKLNVWNCNNIEVTTSANNDGWISLRFLAPNAGSGYQEPSELTLFTKDVNILLNILQKEIEEQNG